MVIFCQEYFDLIIKTTTFFFKEKQHQQQIKADILTENLSLLRKLLGTFPSVSDYCTLRKSWYHMAALGFLQGHFHLQFSKCKKNEECC